MRSNNLYAGNILAIIAAGMLWGTTGTSQAFLTASASPLSVGTVRLAFGGLILLGIVLIKEGLKGIKGPWPLKATLIAVLGVAGFQASFFCAVLKTGVAAGTMIAAGTAPIFAGILGYLVEKEKLSVKWFIATLIGITGVVLLAVGKQKINADMTGILLALSASALYAIYGLGIKKMSQTNSASGTMAVILSLGTVLVLPAFFILDYSWLATPRGFGIGLYLGLAATAIAYSLFARGISKIPISSTYTLSLSEPLTACLLGVFLLGEKLPAAGILGVLLLFLGLIILSFPAGKFNYCKGCNHAGGNEGNEEKTYRFLRTLNSAVIWQLWTDYQQLDEKKQIIPLRLKLRNMLRYRIFDFSIYKKPHRQFLFKLQELYYLRRIEELEEKMQTYSRFGGGLTHTANN